MDIFVARQPIFTTKKTIFGYELLFRHGLENAFPDIDGDIATLKVLSNTFFSFELKDILSDKPGLINFTKKLILQKRWGFPFFRDIFFQNLKYFQKKKYLQIK